MRKTLLFVVTSHADLGDTGARTGAWLEELAAPYAIFEEAGYDTLIASPRGGTAPIDPASLEAPWLTPVGQSFLANPSAMAKMADSLPLDAVDPARIDAIFLVGGTGTMWDFPTSAPLGKLLSALAAAGKPVAAVCHGVAGLMTATTPGGQPLVKGRRLTCFSNVEERMLEYDRIVPLLAETGLVDQGALFECAAPFEARVVRDGLLFTGQNPASAGPLAEDMIAATG